MYSQQRPTVVFVNTGKMYVNTNINPSTLKDDTTLYIKGSVNMIQEPKIVQNGFTNITGDFYYDPTLSQEVHVFGKDDNGNGNTGTVVFSGSNYGLKRYIKTPNNATFNRANKYITFPNISIQTNDDINVDSRLGLDAITIKQNGKKGTLHLLSEVITESGVKKVYDTSLRITGTGSSSSLVSSGSVVTERDATIYYDAISGNTPVFGFASPFNGTQQAGYFAANWVAKAYSGGILSDYVTSNTQSFNPTDGYFIRICDKTNFYSDTISNLLPFLAGQNIKETKTKFVFNGKIYSAAVNTEQLFAENSISKTLTAGNYCIIGNSYTAPISIAKLADLLNNSYSTTFDGKLYLMTYGTTSYQPYNYSNTSLNDASTNAITQIPSTAVFALMPTASGTVSLTKDLLVHDASQYNIKKSIKKVAGNVYDQVGLTVSLASNSNIYDHTTVTVYDQASLGIDNDDAQKMMSSVFSLYSMTSDNVPMALNVIPTETKPIDLGFKVNTQTTDFVLSVSDLKIVNGDGFWIEDKKENSLVQLNEGEQYSFTADPTDDANRFVAYFHLPTSSINTSNLKNISVNCKNDMLNILYLNDVDRDSKISIVDLQGRVVKNDVVSDVPTQTLNVAELTSGVYIVKIEGKRNMIAKFIK